MKKLLLILLSLTLCACQAPTKSTTSTSKKACDVTSEEEKCNEKDNTKTNFNEINACIVPEELQSLFYQGF